MRGGEARLSAVPVPDDAVRVALDDPQTVDAQLAAEPDCAEFFAGLSNSLQRLHVDQVNDAKTPETRQRRIEKSLALFREGRKR